VKAGGELREEAARALEKRLDDPALRDKTVVIVQHHPPTPPQLVDGLRGYERVLAMLRRHPRVRLLHGHIHALVDRARTFGAPATVDDSPRSPRVRLYDVEGGDAAQPRPRAARGAARSVTA